MIKRKVFEEYQKSKRKYLCRNRKFITVYLSCFSPPKEIVIKIRFQRYKIYKT